MSHRTKYFLVGSVLVMSAALCTGLVAYYNGNLPLRASNIGPAELVYLPTDTAALAYADVRQIMDSDFRQKLRQVLPSGQEKDRLLAEIGLDIEHDIDSVVAGFIKGEPSVHGALVLVRGKFNTTQMEALAVQHGAQVQDYKGKRMIVASLPTVQSGTGVEVDRFNGSLAFLEPGLIAVGDAGAIQRGIDASISHEDATKNTELMKYVGDAENGSNAWAIGQFDEMTKGSALPSELKDHFDTVKWFVVSAHIDGGVSGRVRAEARDDETGQQLRAAVTGVLAAGQLVSGRDSRLDSILKSIQVSGTGSTVAMSFIVPPEILDMLNGAASIKNLIESEKRKESAPKQIVK